MVAARPWWDWGPGAAYQSHGFPSALTGDCYPFSFGINFPSPWPSIYLFLCLLFGASSLWLFGDAQLEMPLGARQRVIAAMWKWLIMKYGAVTPSHQGGKSPTGKCIIGIGGKGMVQQNLVEVCFAPAPAKSGVASSLPPLSAPDARNSTAACFREPCAHKPTLPRP